MIATTERYAAMLDAASAVTRCPRSTSPPRRRSTGRCGALLRRTPTESFRSPRAGPSTYPGGAVNDMALGCSPSTHGPCYPVLIGLHTDHATAG